MPTHFEKLVIKTLAFLVSSLGSENIPLAQGTDACITLGFSADETGSDNQLSVLTRQIALLDRNLAEAQRRKETVGNERDLLMRFQQAYERRTQACDRARHALVPLRGAAVELRSALRLSRHPMATMRSYPLIFRPVTPPILRGPYGVECVPRSKTLDSDNPPQRMS